MIYCVLYGSTWNLKWLLLKNTFFQFLYIFRQQYSSYSLDALLMVTISIFRSHVHKILYLGSLKHEMEIPLLVTRGAIWNAGVSHQAGNLLQIEITMWDRDNQYITL